MTALADNHPLICLHHCGFIERNFDYPEDPHKGLWGEYGFAIDDCREHDDGTLWVDNGEYANRVSYCPFCGYESKRKIPHKLLKQS